MFLAGLISVICVAAVSIVADARRRARQRGAIFDRCHCLFDTYETSTAPDGFARLDGRIDTKCCRLTLIPDSLTIKRLPQLWLSVYVPFRTSGDFRIAVTARPHPEDFFSASAPLRHRFEIPSWLPQDLAIRSSWDGEARCVEAWIERHRPHLREAFDDALVKEIAVGPNGVRLVYRLAEGDRGQHLLLRQSRFDAALTPELLSRLLRLLHRFDQTPDLLLDRAA